MDNQKTGNLIKEIRKEKGLTQKQLADILHITDRAVSKWERGLSAPDISLLEPLAQVLDITVMEIISGEKQSEKIEDVNTAVKNIIDYSEKEIKNKTISLKRKMVLWIFSLCTVIGMLIPVYNGLVSGDGFSWRCVPAYITAEKAVKAIKNYDKQGIESNINDSENMHRQLLLLEQQGVRILEADTKLSQTKLEDMFLLIEVEFVVEYEEIKYKFTANGTYRNGKVEFMNIVTEDIYKNYPQWMISLNDALSTYNPG